MRGIGVLRSNAKCKADKESITLVDDPKRAFDLWKRYGPEWSEEDKVIDIDRKKLNPNTCKGQKRAMALFGETILHFIFVSFIVGIPRSGNLGWGNNWKHDFDRAIPLIPTRPEMSMAPLSRRAINAAVFSSQSCFPSFVRGWGTESFVWTRHNHFPPSMREKCCAPSLAPKYASVGVILRCRKKKERRALAAENRHSSGLILISLFFFKL